MAEKETAKTPVRQDERTPDTDAADYVRGGKGRKDEVGRSGVYPASSPDAPANAEIRGPGEFVKHTTPRRTSNRRKQRET